MIAKKKGGFTLVELLVVIAIIGVMVGLLLPAVQAAREAARRMSCSNNLKQISLGLQNYHDTFKVFPYGDEGISGNTWGSNWRLRILPFMEQNALYDQWQFGPSHGWAGSSPRGVANMTAQLGFSPAWAICPSSPLEKFANARTDVRGNQPNTLLNFTYFGISGAENSPDGTWVSGKRNDGGAVKGVYAADGMLPSNELIGMEKCTDGTSNTAIMAEISNFTFNATRLVKEDRRPGATWGWMMGTNNANIRNNVDAVASTTTIRYAPNSNMLGAAGVSLAATENERRNTPLTSAHPGGVQLALVDGSVRFISDSINMNTLTFLCVRDDGRSITLD